MNKILYKYLSIGILIITFGNQFIFAQDDGGMKIGKNPSKIQPAAILEMESTNKGILLPRIQDTALINIFNPPDGMMVYVMDAQNKQQLYIKQKGIWADVQTSININTSINNSLNALFGKKSISSADSSITIINGDTAVFRNVILLVNKNKVVNDSAVSRVLLSTLVLDSLAQAIRKSPVTDSLISLINKQILGMAHSISAENPIIKIRGGEGASLTDVAISIDNTELGHSLNTSPVKDTLLNIIDNRITGKINYADSNAVFITASQLKDTATAIRSSINNLKNGVDTVYASSDTIYWNKNGNKFFSIIDTFKTNITAHLQTGFTFGKYGNGQTISSQGKSASQVIIDALTQAIPPSYSAPTTGITGVVAGGTYEYGSHLGTITLSSTFNQNDAGSLNSTTYYANLISLGSSNTFTIASLTSQQSAYVTKTYNQGPCKNNNLGSQDCSGSISAGIINSAIINWTPGYRRYYGWINDTTGITTGAQNAAILALVENSQFSTSQVFGSAASPINTGNPAGTEFYVFGYVSTSQAITSITQNGIPSFNAYNSAVLSNFMNNQNAVVSIRIYYSKNGQTSSSTIITN